MTPWRRPILAGLRIVELSAFVAAPICGWTLAALGADVIRVDPPGGGVDISRWPVVNGRSLYWTGLNQRKRSIVIDTQSLRGRRQVAKLVAAPGDGGGILLTNLPISGWNSYDELSKAREDLIMVVITGRRDGGTAVDYTVNAALGFPLVTGPENHVGPVNHVLPAWDALTGYLAATAILAAERHRRLTGEGQLVELSLEDVGLAVTANLGYLAEAQLAESPRGRYGNYIYGTFGRDFDTGDGRSIVVVALTPRQWANLTEATNLVADFAALGARLGLDFQDEGDRWRGRVEISVLLSRWISDHDLADVRRTFDAHGVLWSPYRTFKELVGQYALEPSKEPVLQQVDEPKIGRYIVAASPLRFGAASMAATTPGPDLGQHTAEVMREFELEIGD